MQSTIVFLGHDASQTGAPHSLLKIVKWFALNTQFRVIVVLNRSGPLVDSYVSVAETHIWQKEFAFFWRFSFFKKFLINVWHKFLLHKIKKSRPVCIFNNTGVNGTLVSTIKIKTGATVVSRIPELEAFMLRNSVNGSAQLVIKNSDHFVAVSDAVRRNLHVNHAVPLSKISIVYGSCEISERFERKSNLRASLNISEDSKIVCGCGTMDWRKGFDLFMQTAWTVCSRKGRSDIKFVWIGSPISPETEIEYDHEIQLLELQANFFRLGSVMVPSKCFAQSDVFFLSSREDPFPLVMLEAARQALPIICFEGSGGAVEFVDDEIGVVVPMLDIERASDEIISLIDNASLIRRKGIAAYQKSLEYSVEKMASSIFDVISSVSQ